MQTPNQVALAKYRKTEKAKTVRQRYARNHRKNISIDINTYLQLQKIKGEEVSNDKLIRRLIELFVADQTVPLFV